MTQCIG